MAAVATAAGLNKHEGPEIPAVVGPNASNPFPLRKAAKGRNNQNDTAQSWQHTALKTIGEAEASAVEAPDRPAIIAEVGEQIPGPDSTLSPTRSAAYFATATASSSGEGAFQAYTKPEQEQREVVNAIEVNMVTENDEEYGAGSIFSCRDKVCLGCIMILASVGLAVGVGIGLSRDEAVPAGLADNNSSLDNSSACPFQVPWATIGLEVTHPVIVSNHAIDGSYRYGLSTSFGSDVSLSKDGSRLAVTDRFADNVTIHEFNETVGDWMQLGAGIVATQGPIDFTGSAELNEGQCSVVLSGDGTRVAIGFLFFNAINRTRIGRVAVHEYADGSWAQLGNDITGEYSGAYLGLTGTIDLSEDGSVLAVGDFRYDKRRGRVQVYQLTNNTWAQLGKDIVGKRRGDQFGGGVSLSADGRVVAVSVQRAEGTRQQNTGSAAVFRVSGSEGNWTQVGNDLEAELGHCYFGWPVSLSADGSRLAVRGTERIQEVFDGTSCTDLNPENTGARIGEVRVYEYRGGFWRQLGPGFKEFEIADGDSIGDGFGWAISLSGDGNSLAIGASNSDTGSLDRGYSRVFHYEHGVWKQVGDFNGTGPSVWHGFAVSLSYSGERFAVGAPTDYGIPTNESGTVTVYGLVCGFNDVG